MVIKYFNGMELEAIEEPMYTTGRPRTRCPQPKETIELGQDLVKWATEETQDPFEKRTTWSIWYALRQGMIKKHWRTLKQREEFVPYYEIARAAMTQKTHSQHLEKGLAHRYVGMYDRDLYDYEDEQADKDMARKKKAFEDGTADLSDYKAWLNEKKKK